MSSTNRREDRLKKIQEIGGNRDVSAITEMQKMQVLNSLIEDFEDALKEQSKATNRLSIVLTVATVVIALISLVEFLMKVFL